MKKLNLYRLSQEIETGYDTYDSCVVAAESEDAACQIHPGTGWDDQVTGCETWAHKPDQVKVELIGTAVIGLEPGVVLASFNAG